MKKNQKIIARKVHTQRPLLPFFEEQAEKQVRNNIRDTTGRKQKMLVATKKEVAEKKNFLESVKFIQLMFDFYTSPLEGE